MGWVRGGWEEERAQKIKYSNMKYSNISLERERRGPSRHAEAHMGMQTGKGTGTGIVTG